jgi:hypothetical protein
VEIFRLLGRNAKLFLQFDVHRDAVSTTGVRILLHLMSLSLGIWEDPLSYIHPKVNGAVPLDFERMLYPILFIFSTIPILVSDV